jgi:hypothetical protein
MTPRSVSGRTFVDAEAGRFFFAPSMPIPAARLEPFISGNECFSGMTRRRG